MDMPGHLDVCNFDFLECTVQVQKPHDLIHFMLESGSQAATGPSRTSRRLKSVKLLRLLQRKYPPLVGQKSLKTVILVWIFF